MTASDDLRIVQIIGLPVAVHARASQHMDAVKREFELIRRAEPDIDTTPHRLQVLSDELHAQFGGLTDEQEKQLGAAIERGDDSIDVEYRVPAAAADASQRLGDLLDEVDDYCRAGTHLLTLVTPPEALTY